MYFKAQLIIVLDGFDSWKLLFVDPIHKFPRTLLFVHNFLNFKVKEHFFSGLDHTSEGFPVV